MRAAVAVFGLVGLTACSKDRNAELQEIKEAACTCKSKSCATEIGNKLTKLAVDSELDERQVRLALEATTCLAALGE